MSFDHTQDAVTEGGGIRTHRTFPAAATDHSAWAQDCRDSLFVSPPSDPEAVPFGLVGPIGGREHRIGLLEEHGSRLARMGVGAPLVQAEAG
jgi:hypothetical protein